MYIKSTMQQYDRINSTYILAREEVISNAERISHIPTLVNSPPNTLLSNGSSAVGGSTSASTYRCGGSVPRILKDIN